MYEYLVFIHCKLRVHQSRVVVKSENKKPDPLKLKSVVV